ncbi:CbtA family protein [Tropicibacter alexandrii]|uniref:CbtA family protein n=1 Tax=Tropicibacter alexandrii TaxID=2267683 RepID=UPI00100873CB|nr:CbtA family protein [Tropicibacter alexandrii]
MTRLLVLGLLAGLLASVVTFGVARLVGEPALDAAIAMKTTDSHTHATDTPDLSDTGGMSRHLQAGPGLFVGLAAVGVALGGILAISFAVARGRILHGSTRATVAWITALGFAAVIVVPMLKFPGNPPAVGNPETIGARTLAYFAFLALSLATLGPAVSAVKGIASRRRKMLIGAGIYAGVMSGAAILLPSFHEVDPAFPRDLLWQFRASTLAVQATLWASTGIAFGWLVERFGQSI